MAGANDFIQTVGLRLLEKGADESRTIDVGAQVMWWIWKTQGSWVFERTPWNVDRIVANALRLQPCAEGVCINDTGESNLEKQQPRWTAPVEGEVKLNVDAAIGSNCTNVAVLARDHSGELGWVAAE